MKFVSVAVAALATLTIARPGTLNVPKADDQPTTPANPPQSQDCVQCAANYGNVCFADVTCFQSCNDECQDCVFCCAPQQSELHQRDSSPCQGCYATYDECIELCHDDVTCRKACDSDMCNSSECFSCQNSNCIHTALVNAGLSKREDTSPVISDRPPQTEESCDDCDVTYDECLHTCNFTDQCISRCRSMLCGSQFCRTYCGYDVCHKHESTIDDVPAAPSTLSKREDTSPVLSGLPPQTEESCDDCDVTYDECLHTCNFTDQCINRCRSMLCGSQFCRTYCGYDVCHKHESPMDEVSATPSTLSKRENTSPILSGRPQSKDVLAVRDSDDVHLIARSDTLDEILAQLHDPATTSVDKDTTDSILANLENLPAEDLDDDDMNKVIQIARLLWKLSPDLQDIFDDMESEGLDQGEGSKLTILAALVMAQNTRSNAINGTLARDLASLPVPPPQCLGCENHYLECIRDSRHPPSTCREAICLNPDSNHRCKNECGFTGCKTEPVGHPPKSLNTGSDAIGGILARDLDPIPVPPPPCLGCETRYLKCIQPCPTDPGCQKACRQAVCLNPDLNHRCKNECGFTDC
ncbi:uncharacterized protein BDZ99DRAFT_500757 [Mytilinidion resinicola]|uniref:Uncharacterized protein n=1 Tax=Mytilinidion resinicola TaxID=574789 RepID=A0A6A6YCW5_9PEZI|nr:uncharacterized protein BDZ99DRAFT_500757 [Mytilinidion resinicola]KAF2806661.1 hypothetical protein BDZ99DRAFT_500757 [Mytilinidion resinicola]